MIDSFKLDAHEPFGSAHRLSEIKMNEMIEVINNLQNRVLELELKMNRVLKVDGSRAK